MHEAQRAASAGEARGEGLAGSSRMIDWAEQRRLLVEAERLRLQAVGDGLRWLGRGLRRLVAAVRRREQRRAGLQQLLALDDHTLADIGLRRPDLQAVARGLVRWEQVFVTRPGEGDASAEVVRLPERAPPERPARDLDVAA